MKLTERLEELNNKGVYPFHMPGHKRHMSNTAFDEAYRFDITEIENFDNLHHAQGILKELQCQIGDFYGGAYTRISVNGSTAGILAAISGSLKDGEKIILDRRSHKAAFNACGLRNLHCVYAYPENEGMFAGRMNPETIGYLLDRHPDTKGVFITSPTYDGIVSDVERIANLCHEAGVPLIVDEAHGAHFFLDKRFPKGALEAGADIVIHSIHKTLPAPTQTAVVHLQGNLVSKEKLDKYLSVYMSSSPSYLLMAMIEQCFCLLKQEGLKLTEEFFENINDFYDRAEGLKNIGVVPRRADKDISKIIIFNKSSQKAFDGVQIGRALRDDYLIEPEMVTGQYVCCLASLMDSKEGFERLFCALEGIDDIIEYLPTDEHNNRAGLYENSFFAEKNIESINLREAMDAQSRQEKPELCEGEKSAGFVQLYPPGIPLLVPGEIINKTHIGMIGSYIDSGLMVEGLDDGKLWILK